MRYHMVLMAVLLSLFCGSCLDSKEGFLHISFTVDYNIPEQTLDGDPLLSLLPPQMLPDIPIDMNADSEFNTRVFDHIVRIWLEGLVFTINAKSTNPAYDDEEPSPSTPDDWSFLESAEIWIKHPGTGLEEKVAYTGTVTPGVPTLAFTCLHANIAEYFDSGYNSILIIRAQGTFPPDDVIFDATANFKITAALIK